MQLKICPRYVNTSVSSLPLLVLSALDEGRVGGHAGDGGGGVPVPQVESHLEIAEHHADHGEEVGHQEQHDVVPAVRPSVFTSAGGWW